ncbi:hypothetical protein GF322_00735 [Candidatus Dependentiae bacterium]|nr:hypothetical protein [Candidatus Dependentiae bacterium]
MKNKKFLIIYFFCVNIFIYSFINSFDHKSNVENLPILDFFFEAKMALKFNSLNESRIIDDLNTLIDLTKDIIINFEKGTFSYNPELWIQFLNICQNFKSLEELNLAEFRKLFFYIKEYDNNACNYLKSRTNFLSKKEIDLLNNIREFNLLLLGVILNEDFLKFSIWERVVDCMYDQPREFIHENKELFFIFGILTSSFMTYLFHPYIKKAFFASNKKTFNKNLIVCKDKCGIKNLGNTCYFNSTLQCIAGIKSLRSFLIKLKQHFNKNTTIFNLIEFVEELGCKKGKILEPRELINAIKRDFFGESKCSFEQQDAAEFIRFILAKINDNDPERIISFESNNKISCCNCNNSKDRSELYHYIDVQVGSKNGKTHTLKACLNDYIKEEILQDYSCDNCGHTTKGKKKIEFNSVPDVLIINLKRFKNDLQNGRFVKIQDPIIFDYSNFDFKTYLTEQAQELYKDKTSYDLVAFISHNGSSIDRGHYIAHNKDLETNKWYYFNDSTCYEIPEREIIQQIQKDSPNQYSTPYILFYKKRNNQ